MEDKMERWHAISYSWQVSGIRKVEYNYDLC